MLRYIIKQYIRNISRRKIFSFINIIGLAFAVAFVILIGQFLFIENNYNHELKNADNIYRLVNTKSKSYSIFDYRIKDQIIASIPGIKDVCLLNHFPIEANVKNNIFKIDNMLVVDQDFFKMFDVHFIFGNPATALSSADNIVITESSANRIFGTTDALGKVIKLNHQNDMIVTGIVKNLPEDISFKGDIFVSYKNSIMKRLYYKCLNWGDDKTNNEQILFNVFVELKNGKDFKSVENRIAALNKLNSSLYPKDVILTPLKTNYFNMEFEDADLMHGNVDLMKILTAIGIFILLLAVINFLNLSTASHRYRLTEISVKKCLGADRKILIKQLLTESFFTCAISSLLGIAFAELFLPYFNKFIDKPISLQIFGNIHFFILFITFILLLSLLTGFLPAIILSKISPTQVLKAYSYLKGSGRRYRSILTMLQFAISIILICSLIIITKQIDFVKHKDLGFNTEHLLYLKVHYTLKNRIQVLADKLGQYPGIKAITKTFGIPGDINLGFGEYGAIVIDTATIKTFGFKLVDGRNLLSSDDGSYNLINQAALKKLGGGDYKNYKIGKTKIAGVIADFNYSSLYNKIEPLILMYNNKFDANYITMKISGPIGKTINYIKQTWEEVCPDYPMEFGFYDEYFNSMYKREENFASLISIFSILAVVISCLGIFGLSVFQSEQKIKEIGIRKVFGASSWEILMLLIRNFSRWVLLANIIAIPIAYYLMNKWLQDFAYRINVSWWIFALAGGIALLIALTTISIQAIRAATANPVKSLRYE